jgi:hypothetical protein
LQQRKPGNRLRRESASDKSHDHACIHGKWSTSYMTDYGQTSVVGRGQISSGAKQDLGRKPDIGSFAKVPSKFFGSGTAAKVGPAAALLYLAPHEHSNRKNALTFTASSRALAADTGLSERTICGARKKLMGAGLISCTRGKGESFTYTLLPQEQKWVPMKDRPRQKRKARGRQLLKVTDQRDETRRDEETLIEEPEDFDYRDDDQNFPKWIKNPANYARPYSRKVN